MANEFELQVLDQMRRCRYVAAPKGFEQRCALGIDVRALVGGDDIGWVTRMPCRPIGEPKNGCTVSCDKRDPFTREEAEANVRERERHIEAVLSACTLAHSDALAKGFGKPTRKNPNLTSGASQIDCPVCGTGKLRYSVASVNGHMHAGCTTTGCISWME